MNLSSTFSSPVVNLEGGPADHKMHDLFVDL